MKKIILGLAVTLMSLSCFGESLTFQVIQHNKTQKDICQSSLIVEDEIMNHFFNAGYIVSNLPACMSSSVTQDERLFANGMNEAIDGASDDFVQIHLYYNDKKNKKTSSLLGDVESIEWKVLSLKTGQLIEKNKKEIIKSRRGDDEDQVRSFALDFAMHIQEVLGNV